MRLQDFKCSTMHFQPGDRILVKVAVPLDNSQRQKIQRTVEKWAGTGIEVLIIDQRFMDLEVVHG